MNHKKALPLILIGLILPLVALSLLVTPATRAAGNTIYVDKTATGAATGLSWTDAYTDVQEALATANSGDEIWVAAGTYTPTSGTDRNVSFALKDGVALYGGFAGNEDTRDQRDWTQNETILSGDIGNTPENEHDNSYHVVLAGGVDDTAVLDGFTIRDGNAFGKLPFNSGGGIKSVDSSLTMANLRVTGNRAGLGGGVRIEGGAPTLANVRIVENSASGDAGGMYVIRNADLTLNNVNFIRNSAGGNGGGLSFDWNADGTVTINGGRFDGNVATNGGGIYAFYSPLSLTDVIFSGNQAEAGGGLYASEVSDIQLTGVTFQGNEATASNGGGMFEDYGRPILRDVRFIENRAAHEGGGLYALRTSLTLQNGLFKHNRAADGGGMAGRYGSRWDINNAITLINTTFSGNEAVGDTGVGGGIMFYDPDGQIETTIANSIFWGNRDSGEIEQDAQISGGRPDVSYSLVAGQTFTGTGNISADPRFVSENDLHLRPGSPAIDAGNNEVVTDTVKTDLAGNPRFVDVASVPDSGQGDPPLVDMGAYEAAFADLVLQKQVAPAAVMPGQPLTYTLTFSNTGSLTATDVTLTDVIPAEIDVTSVITGGGPVTDTGATPPFVWEIADLAAGTGGTITLQGRVDPQLSSATTVTNTASIDSPVTDGDSTTNLDQAVLEVAPSTVRFSQESFTVPADGGSATITVTLDKANPYTDISVAYRTADDTARAGRDYEATSGRLTFPAGTTRATFTVPVYDNDRADSDRALWLELSDPAGATLATPDRARLIIEAVPPGVRFSQESFTIEEGGGSATITATLDKANPSADISVAYRTADDSARAGRDYEATSGRLTFPAGTTRATFTVPVYDNDRADSDRALRLELSDPAGATLATPDRARLAIANEDMAGVTVTPGELYIEADGKPGVYSVTLTSEPVADVMITIETDGQVTVDPVALTFTPGNWNIPQQVTVEPLAVDGTGTERQLSTIRHRATSADAVYDGIAVPDLPVYILPNLQAEYEVVFFSVIHRTPLSPFGDSTTP